MDNLICLIPFKVRLIEPPSTETIADSPSPITEMRDMLWRGVLTNYAENKKHLWGEIWTVVGSTGIDGYFLVIKPGKVAQWYPERFCQAIAVAEK